MNTLVSVIVPAHNAEGTLATTLHTLLAQSCSFWEAVIVDDGSTDGTRAIASDFAGQDRRFTVVSQAASGESRARNAGLQRAKADWVLFLDADDTISPNHIASLLAVASRNDHLDAVHCGWVRVTTDNRASEPRHGPETEDLFNHFVRYNPFAIHACLVKSALVKAVGCFDPSLRTCPDWDLWQRIARTGARFGRTLDVLAYYRMTPASAGLNAVQVLIDGVKVIERGHSTDARCPNPHSAHRTGAPRSQLPAALLTHLCWAAGLAVGSGADPKSLLRLLEPVETAYLDSRDIGYRLFESCVLPRNMVLQEWPVLWPQVKQSIRDFLTVLQTRASSPDLAVTAYGFLENLIAQRALADDTALQPDTRQRSHKVSPPLPAESSHPPTEKRMETISFGYSRRLTPVSMYWGYDRGLPVDRYYIEDFLRQYSGDIRGTVLEVGDNTYSLKFGATRVVSSHVLDVSDSNSKATIVADLSSGDTLPSCFYDSVIITQTLHLIFDVKSAVKTLHRILKPNGVALVTLPGITRISTTEWPGSWFWSFTSHSARSLFSEYFANDDVRVTAYGNVLAASAFLYGCAAHELTTQEIEFHDPQYEVIVSVRAIKRASEDLPQGLIG